MNRDLIGPNELARLLGVTRNTVHRMACRGAIPAHALRRYGAQTRYSRAALIALGMIDPPAVPDLGPPPALYFTYVTRGIA